ncbi:MAG: SPOR domain-containing protein, partial [Trueperaceae bacterium]|nr:SPOR domain-containing protein [Trueperaceae bacterium]
TPSRCSPSAGRSTSTAAAPSAPAALPAASSDEQAPYRVAVGAFGNADNATRQAARFRDAGFPVFTGVQGDLTIVLVGPYALESEAEAVAARIADGDFGIDPVVYRFRPDAGTPGASTPAPSAASEAAPAPASRAPAAPAAAAPAAAPPAASTGPIATSSSGRSLQVGAFADANSAAPLRERLAGVGLTPFEVREDGLTKLIVGPFDAEGLVLARERLAELGIESFPR